MRQSAWILVGVVSLVGLCSMVDARSVVKRQAEIDPTLQEVDSDETPRDKRKVDAAFGVKNAVLGFVFNKINSFLDQKTAWINELDKTNIAKNKAHNIEVPKDPILSLSGVISGVIGEKLQAVGPLITVVTNKLSGGSGHNGGGIIGLLKGGLGSGGAHINAGVSAGYEK